MYAINMVSTFIQYNFGQNIRNTSEHNAFQYNTISDLNDNTFN